MKTIKILFAVLIFLAAFESKAQYVAIPDSNFGKWLNTHGYNGCLRGNSATGWQMDTTCSSVQTATSLDCQQSNIRNLTGISFFKQLVILDCHMNSLASLPLLPASLRALVCSINQLTTLPVLPALTNLDCTDNQLSTLPTLPAALRYLYCQNNQLNSLPTLPASLDILTCYNNQLSSLPSLPSILTNLSCGTNHLSTLPSLPTSLIALACSTNQLSSLPLLPASLGNLDCSQNQLTSLPSLPALMFKLYCSSNQLSILPSLPASLSQLNCSGNPLDSLPSLPASLTYLDCSNDSLTRLPSLPVSLTTLYCYSNHQLTGIPNLPDSLYIFHCGDNTSLSCLPTIHKVRFFSFFSTGITCLPNFPTNTNCISNPTLAGISLCTPGNANGCFSSLVSAGPDQTMGLNSTATMAATGTGTWTVGSGNPSIVTFTNASLPTTTVTGFTVAGVYTLIYGNGTMSDTMLVTVQRVNLPPTADTVRVVELVDQLQDINVSLAAGDPNADPLTFSIVSNPNSSFTIIRTGNGAYTITNNTAGNYTIQYQVCDKNSNASSVLCDTSVILLHTIAPTDTLSPLAPLCSNDRATITSGGAATVNVRGNDYSPAGHALNSPVIISTSVTATGVWSVDANGQLVFTSNGHLPAGIYIDTAQYRVCDQVNFLCATASVIVTTNNVDSPIMNRPPVAADDHVTVAATASININVKGNDSDPDGDDLGTPTIISSPQNGGITAVNTNGTISFTPYPSYIGADMFEYVVCDTNAAHPVFPLCDTADVYITVIGTYSAGPDQTICQNTTATMAATGTGSWTAVSGNPGTTTIAITTLATTDISGFTISGVYSFAWTNGSGSDTVNVTVNVKPTVSIYSPDTILCGSQSAMLVAIVQPSGGTFHWSPLLGINPLAANTDTVYISVPTNQSYTVRYIIGGCADTASQIIYAFPSLQADAGLDQSICVLDTNPIILGGAPTASGGTNSYTYQWSPGIAVINLTTANPVTRTPGASSWYYVTVTDSISGCIAVDSMMITVNPPSRLTSSGFPSQICSGDYYTGTVSSNIAGTNIVWTTSLGLNGIGGNINEILVNNSSSPIVVRFSYVGTVNGCTSPALIDSVIVNPTPILTASGFPSQICSGAYYSGTVSSNIAGTAITWTASPIASSGSSGNINAQLYNPTGSPILVYFNYIGTINGCTSVTLIDSVTVNPSPGLSISGFPAVGCSGTYFNGSVSSNISGTAINWTNNIGQNGTTGNFAATLLYNHSSAPLPVIYTISGAVNGCTSYLIDTVILHPKPDAGPDQYIHLGDTATMAAIGTGTWSAFPTNFSATVFGDSISPITTISGFSSARVYNYFWTDGGCPDTATVIVSNPCGITANSRSGCLKAYVVDLQDNGGAGHNTNWTITSAAGAVLNVTNNDQASWQIPDCGRFVVHMTNNLGCDITDSNFVTNCLPVIRGGFTSSAITVNQCVSWIDSSLAGAGCIGLQYLIDWRQGPIDTLPGLCRMYSTNGVFSPTFVFTNSCGCVADTTFTNAISIVSDSVWPGDANRDGIADNFDLLNIGLAYDSTGAVRPAASPIWVAQYCSNWADTFASGINFKYADCDGNGHVDASDTVPLMLNFGNTHTKTNSNHPYRSGQPIIYPTLSADTITGGDTILISIHLGQVLLTANNVYGVAFDLNYDAAVIDTTKTKMGFPSSWLGGPSDMISIYKDGRGSGVIKAALTRIDHTTRSGQGEIAYVRAIVTTDNIDGKNLHYYRFQCSISNVKMIDQNGNVILINEGTDSNEVAYTPLGIDDLTSVNAQLTIYPNPANDVATITCAHANINAAEVLNLLGEKVREYQFSNNKSNQKLDLHGLSSGVYYISVKTPMGAGIKKLVINN